MKVLEKSDLKNFKDYKKYKFLGKLIGGTTGAMGTLAVAGYTSGIIRGIIRTTFSVNSIYGLAFVPTQIGAALGIAAIGVATIVASGVIVCACVELGKYIGKKIGLSKSRNKANTIKCEVSTREIERIKSKNKTNEISKGKEKREIELVEVNTKSREYSFNKSKLEHNVAKQGLSL